MPTNCEKRRRVKEKLQRRTYEERNSHLAKDVVDALIILVEARIRKSDRRPGGLVVEGLGPPAPIDEARP